MSYSTDLREKVLNFIEQGGLVTEACEIFEVSRSSIQRWRLKKRLLGRPITKPRKVGSYKINDSALRVYIKANPEAYLSEIATHFDVTVSGIFRALNRLKITRKKSRPFTRKEMNQND